MKRAMAVVAAVVMLISVSFAADPMKLEDLITKHLASIGTPEARAAIKTRAAVGTTHYVVVTGGSGMLDGKTQVVSDGQNLRYIMRFNTPKYLGDDFTANGEKVWVAANTSGRRQVLSKFVYDMAPVLVHDGLIAGTLSTAWPLLDPKTRSAKLTYNGIKKIDGVELHDVKYVPKDKTDLEIHLYFDPTTFRHVRTVATASIDPRLVKQRAGNTRDFMERGMGGQGPGGGRSGSPSGQGLTSSSGEAGASAQSLQQVVYYRLDQKFDDFQQVDGLTLPMKSTIRFSADGYNSELLTYENKYDQVQNNVGLDPKNFEIK